jgi:hypothetical protein
MYCIQHIICLDVLSKTTDVRVNTRNGEQPEFLPHPLGRTELRNVSDWFSTFSSILITSCVFAVRTMGWLRKSRAVELTLKPLYCPILLWEKWATSLYLDLTYHQRFAASLSYVQYKTACPNSAVIWTTISGPADYYFLSYKF